MDVTQQTLDCVADDNSDVVWSRDRRLELPVVSTLCICNGRQVTILLYDSFCHELTNLRSISIKVRRPDLYILVAGQRALEMLTKLVNNSKNIPATVLHKNTRWIR